MSDIDFNLHKPQPLFLIISGLSGVGKDSVVKEMMKLRLPFHFVVTVTDRGPRPGEVAGKDYIFVTPQKFQAMIDNGEFIEHADVYGENKGVPREQVHKALASGIDVVMRLDVQGAATFRKLVPESILIFLTTRSEAELERRLRNRGTETEEKIRERMKTAREELKRASEYDYVIVNEEGCLSETVHTVISIIEAEHHRTIQKKINL